MLGDPIVDPGEFERLRRYTRAAAGLELCRVRELRPARGARRSCPGVRTSASIPTGSGRRQYACTKARGGGAERPPPMCERWTERSGDVDRPNVGQGVRGNSREVGRRRHRRTARCSPTHSTGTSSTSPRPTDRVPDVQPETRPRRAVPAQYEPSCGVPSSRRPDSAGVAAPASVAVTPNVRSLA